MEVAMLTDEQILKAYHTPSWEDEDAHMKGLREVARAQYKAIVESIRTLDHMRGILPLPTIKSKPRNSSSKQTIGT